MKQTWRKYSFGFSLIELSIVLVVVGLLAAVGIESLTIMSEKSKVAETKKKLDEIELTLASHLRLYGKSPCPSSRLLAESATMFGKAEAACTSGTAAPAGTNQIVRDDEYYYTVRIGMIPIVDLGLPKDYAFDGWGNRFTYAVINQLAVGDGEGVRNYDAYDSTIPPYGYEDGVIIVQDRVGNQLSLEHYKSIIPYVLVSHGKDGKGGYNSSGNLDAACAGGDFDDAFYNAITEDALDDDIENCDNVDTLFIADNPFDISGATDYYDDYVRYKTKNKLEADAEKTTVSGGGAANAYGDANQVQYNNGSDGFAASPGLTFNPAVGLVGNDDGGTAMDFRWETDTLGYGLYLDASANKVSIGMNTATQSSSAITTPSIQVAYASTGSSGNYADRYISLDGANATLIVSNDYVGSPDSDLDDRTTIAGSSISLTLQEDYGNANGDRSYSATFTPYSLDLGGVSLYAGGYESTDPDYGRPYLNFGNSGGSSGYGIRDNSGAVEAKSSGGAWSPLPTTVVANGETITSTSLTNIKGLSVPVAAGTYLIEAEIHGNSSTVAGYTLGINHSGTTTSLEASQTGQTSTTAWGATAQITAVNTSSTVLGTTASEETKAFLRGKIVVSTAGNITIQGRKVTSGNFVVRGSSWLRVTKPAQICGNAVVETGEQCDDGNQIELDGCDNQCNWT